MKLCWRPLAFTLFATLAGCGGGNEYQVEHDGGADGGGKRNDAGQLVDDAGRPIDSGKTMSANDSGTGAPADSGGLPGVDSGSGGTGDSGSVAVDRGPAGGPITCSNPGTYKMNGGSCGSERWDIKTGTDPYTGMVSLVPVPTTIATLVGLA